MKSSRIIIYMLALSFIAGCSFHYSVKDFGGKEKFYKNFNEAFYGKSATVTFENNKPLKTNDGVVILNDTLYSIKTSVKEINGKAALSDIDKINYPNANYNKTVIILKDGKKYSAHNLSSVNDSLRFVELQTIDSYSAIAPVSTVSKISYKSKSGNVIPGLTVGSIVGAVVGAVKSITVNSSKDNIDKLPGYILIYTVAGAAIGTITNWLLGTDYIYIFNN